MTFRYSRFDQCSLSYVLLHLHSSEIHHFVVDHQPSMSRLRRAVGHHQT